MNTGCYIFGMVESWENVDIGSAWRQSSDRAEIRCEHSHASEPATYRPSWPLPTLIITTKARRRLINPCQGDMSSEPIPPFASTFFISDRAQSFHLYGAGRYINSIPLKRGSGAAVEPNDSIHQIPHTLRYLIGLLLRSNIETSFAIPQRLIMIMMIVIITTITITNAMLLSSYYSVFSGARWIFKIDFPP